MHKSEGYNSPKGKANNAAKDQKSGQGNDMPIPPPITAEDRKTNKKTTDKEQKS